MNNVDEPVDESRVEATDGSGEAFLSEGIPEGLSEGFPEGRDEAGPIEEPDSGSRAECSGEDATSNDVESGETIDSRTLRSDFANDDGIHGESVNPDETGPGGAKAGEPGGSERSTDHNVDEGVHVDEDGKALEDVTLDNGNADDRTIGGDDRTESAEERVDPESDPAESAEVSTVASDEVTEFVEDGLDATETDATSPENESPNSESPESASPEGVSVDSIPPKTRIEALLFSSSSPVNTAKLAGAADLERKDVKDLVETLNEEYGREGRAFCIVEVAGGYQMLSRAECFEYIQRLVKTRNKEKLSQAMLETLAIIAYKQPIIRADVESIRGVQSGQILRNLLERRLVRVMGRDARLGHPLLYGTTREFLDIFGLKSLKDLPSVEELKTY